MAGLLDFLFGGNGIAPPPQQQPQLYPTTPGGPLGAAFASFANSKGFLPGLANAMGALSTGQRMDPAGLQMGYMNAALNSMPPNMSIAEKLARLTNPEVQKTLYGGPRAVGNITMPGGVGVPLVANGDTTALGIPQGGSMGDLFNAGMKMNAAVEQQKTEIPAFFKQYQGTQDAGLKMAQNVLPIIQQAKTLINDPRFVSGSAADHRLAWRQFVATTGMGDPNAAAPTEALKSALSQLILSEIKPLTQGTGRVMQSEVQRIVDMVGDIPNTASGILSKLNVMEGGANRVIGLANLAQDYYNANGKLDTGFDRLALAHFAREKSPGQYASTQQPISIAPPQQAQQAQPATSFTQDQLLAEARRRGLVK